MKHAAIKKRFEKLDRYLDERLRRLVAGAEALAIGRGGISAVSRETGLCREAIRQGCQELEQQDVLSQGRIRRQGAGRKRTVEQDPTLCFKSRVSMLQPLQPTKGEAGGPCPAIGLALA